MKRFLRGLSLTVLAAILCLSLCSCDALDELRESRAYYTDESQDAVVYGGYTYKKLTVPENISFWGADSVNIADEEIPLLLSPIVGDALYITAEKTVITDDYSVHYCREDVYSAYMTRIALGDLSSYCIIGDDEELEFGGTRKLNDKTQALINTMLAGEPRAYDEEESESGITIYRCDEKAEILEYSLYLVKMLDGSFYLEVWPNVEDDWGDSVSYPVPAEYNALFNNIYEAGW